jgi:hypothetical protein
MPLDNEHKKLWISIIENYSGIRALRKNAQLNNAVVCGKHFGFESFRSHSVHESPKLLPNAVPSIFFCAIDAPNPDETINPPAGDGLSEPPMKKCRLSYVITHDQFHSKTFKKFVI